jgi:hypothetical protein
MLAFARKTEEVSFLIFTNVDPQMTPTLAPPAHTLQMDLNDM